LNENGNQLTRAAVALARQWQSDRYLRKLNVTFKNTPQNLVIFYLFIYYYYFFFKKRLP